MTRCKSWIITFFILVLTQGCQKFERHGSNFGSLASSAVCEEEKKEFFAAEYLPVFKEMNCAKCHSSQPGAKASFLPFVDSTVDLAYSSFRSLPVAAFKNQLAKNHQQSNLNYNKEFRLREIQDINSDYENMIKECQISGKTPEGSVITKAVTLPIFDSDRIGDSQFCSFNDPLSIQTITAPFSISEPETKTLSWDLGELNVKWKNIIIELDVTIDSPLAFPPGDPTYACPSQNGYLVGNLKVSTDTRSVRLKNILILIDGDDKEDRHYYGIDRIFAKYSSKESFFSDGGAYTLLPMDGVPVTAKNEWQLSIEEVEINPIFKK